MSTAADAPPEPALRRDRLIVMAGLAVIILVSWAYAVTGAGMQMSALEMTRMEMMQMHRVLSGQPVMAEGGTALNMTAWSAGYAITMFLMWWIMMIAMMLPTAVPMTLHYTTFAHKRDRDDTILLSTAAYVLGYVLIWGGFSIAGVILQWGLQRITLLTPMLVSDDLALDGFLILAAGIYQFLPMQRNALRYCRSCKQAMPSRWREGTGGALIMGVEEGISCLGVCWLLMGLMFVAGAMNIYWIVALSLLVLLQKHLPSGDLLGYFIGVVLTIWGARVLVVSLF
ncbi:MAG: DUF2182 domain-containing protein [Pseudomonadota bacterium]